MKNLMLFLVAGLLLFTSCSKDDQFLENDDQDWTNEFEDGNTSGGNSGGNTGGNTGGGNHDHGSEEGAISLYEVEGDEIVLVKDYEIDPSLQYLQSDKAFQQEIWSFVTRLLPRKDRGKIAQFELFFGNGELLGYVTPIDHDDLGRWRFALAMDEADNLDDAGFDSDFTYTTIHEFGHVMTLDDTQITVVDDDSSCDTYNPGEGCSKEDSYIKEIFELGWADIIDEHIDADPYEFYQKYQSRFLTEYAATNPAEDIAEVFTFFIIQEDRPTGNTIADRKIKALYTFPELVSLRADIRASIDPVNLNKLTVEGYKALLPKLARANKVFKS